MIVTARWVRAVCLLVPLAALAATFTACGSDALDPNGDGKNPESPGLFCGTPNEGCDCPETGKVVECGSVELKAGNYVSCSMGQRTCGAAGKWGACVGNDIVTKSLVAVNLADELHTRALGMSMMCPPPPSPLANPCDPYCNQFVDDPVGLVLGGGLTVSGGGITVAGGGPVACESPQDWKAYYGQYPAGAAPDGPLPTACSAGPPDNCANDLKCVAGACTARMPGDNGSCIGKDFTLSTPCFDGTRMTFQVCNRGSVAATTGILPIAHHMGSAAPAASTCTIAANGPAGDCTIDLSVKPLMPGQCVEFSPTVDCPLNVPNDNGDQFYFVNQSNTGLPLIAGECNTCNNFTATKDTAKPPLVPLAACNPVSCGGPATSGQPGTFSSSTTGLNTCAGSQDAITNPCNAANGNTNCQQDFHCDLTAGSPTINTCVWNQLTAYDDVSCNGVDLTIGTGCDLGAQYSLPICNRGTKPLPAGAVIKVGQTNSGGYNAWNASCAAGTAVTCTLPALTAPLGPGQCLNTTACPGGAGQRWEIVNADNSIVECGAPGAGCKNNGAQVKDNGAGCSACQCLSGTAELTGKLLDPAKLRPVFGATIYVPSTPVGPLPGPNVQCDTCTNIYSGLPALAAATTDADGTFRMQGVPAGVAFPVVIQLGRFRRQIMVGPIAPCGTAALTPAQAHLPGGKARIGDTLTDTANPNLPLIAMVTGAGDATECLIARMGICSAANAQCAASEFTAPGGGGSVDMYTYAKSNGLTGGAGNAGAGATIPGIGAADALLGTAATLNKYNAVLMPCANQDAQPSAAMQTNVRNWMDSGGRLFASHYGIYDFVHLPVGNANDGSAMWSTPIPWNANNPNLSDRTPTNSLTDDINQTFPKGVSMARWIPLAWPAPGGPGGVAPPFGKLPLPDYRNNFRSAIAPATSWFAGTSAGPGAGAGLQSNMISFDTPFANPPASQCGRAVMPMMHVSGVSSGAFPANCGGAPGALTGQELAFEFMMWEALTCLAPSTVPPVAPPVAPPPPPVPLVTVTLTRDYQAMCPVGTRVEWEFFYWQAIVPLGTNMAFRAETSAMPFPPPPMAPPPAPQTVGIGTASSTIIAPMWGQDAMTVAQHLLNDSPGPKVKSQDYLRVYLTFNPAGGAAPILQNWRQTYDCIPAE